VERLGDVVDKMYKLSAQLRQAQLGLKAMPPITGMLYCSGYNGTLP